MQQPHDLECSLQGQRKENHLNATKTSFKIDQIGGVINKLKCILPEHVLHIMYKTLVLPHQLWHNYMGLSTF